MKADSPTSLSEALKEYSAVLVTGGSSGIGKSFIKLGFTLHPAALICNLSRRIPDINLPELKLRHVPCDLSQSSQISAGVETVLSILNREAPEGRVLLINNSGYGSFGPFLEADLENELGILDVNIRALVDVTGRLLPTLKKRGGAILNVASTAAFQPTPLLATYGASKAFVLNWSVALGEELRGSGVAVVAVCPGPTRTGFAKRAGVVSGSAPGGEGLSPDDVVEISLRALARGQAVVVCGRRNRWLARLASLLPRTFSARVAKRLIGAVKKASP